MGIKMGPVLGFRGQAGGQWKVSALVVVDKGAGGRKLTWGLKSDLRPGTEITKPKSLKKHGEWEVLRFDWAVKQTGKEQGVFYAVDGGETWRFAVPATQQPLRIAYASCNGFSDFKEMKKVIKNSGSEKNALWREMLRLHEGKTRDGGDAADGGAHPFHLLLLGGDQVYSDGMWEDVSSLREWLDEDGWWFGEGTPFDNGPKNAPFFEPGSTRLKEKFSERMNTEVENFYFELYRTRWSQDGVRGPLAQIPSLMMWDDHDIFDGWGSYPASHQNSEIYQNIFRIARDCFQVFQLQEEPGAGPPRWALKGQEGFSYGHLVGDVAVLALDLRSERSQGRVMTDSAWNAARDWAENLKPGSCKHLLVMSSIPVVYPDFNTLEQGLKLLPGQQELEDDLADHWRSQAHKIERLRLIHRLFRVARKKIRVTLLSGDVHVGALGTIRPRKGGEAAKEGQVIHQLISSAIVHPPPPGTVQWFLEKTGGAEEALDLELTARLEAFPGSQKRILGGRNWLSLECDDKQSIWAKWYLEGVETPFTHVVHPA